MLLVNSTKILRTSGQEPKVMHKQAIHPGKPLIFSSENCLLIWATKINIDYLVARVLRRDTGDFRRFSQLEQRF